MPKTPSDDLRWDPLEGEGCPECGQESLLRSRVPTVAVWSGYVMCQTCDYSETVAAHRSRQLTVLVPVEED